MSFGDMMSSGRGPGVVGMLMALVVLLGFGILFVFVFDEGMQGADRSIESIVADQKKEIDRCNKLLIQGQERLASSSGRVSTSMGTSEQTRENEIRKGTIEGLVTAVTDLESELDAKKDAFEDYKNQYRSYARNLAVGQKMKELVTLTGAKYENVEIRAINAVGMQVRHEFGQKRIPFEDLPKDMQDRYQFDAAQRDALIQQELDMRREHEAAVAKSKAAHEAGRDVEKAPLSEKEEDKLKENLYRMRERASELTGEIRQLRRELKSSRYKSEVARGIGRTYHDRSPEIEKDLAYKNNQLSQLKAMIAVAESKL